MAARSSHRFWTREKSTSSDQRGSDSDWGRHSADSAATPVDSAQVAIEQRVSRRSGEPALSSGALGFCVKPARPMWFSVCVAPETQRCGDGLAIQRYVGEGRLTHLPLLGSACQGNDALHQSRPCAKSAKTAEDPADPWRALARVICAQALCVFLHRSIGTKRTRENRIQECKTPKIR